MLPSPAEIARARLRLLDEKQTSEPVDLTRLGAFMAHYRAEHQWDAKHFVEMQRHLDMVTDGEISVTCEFCSKVYAIAPATLETV